MSYFVQNPYDNKQLNIDNPKTLDVPDSVKKLLEQVNNQIKKLDNPNVFFKYDSNTMIEVEDIKHVFVYRYMYRRGTIFVAVQKSSIETKLVWYYTKTIHHSAQCFGTAPTIELINKNKIELSKDQEFMDLVKSVTEEM